MRKCSPRRDLPVIFIDKLNVSGIEIMILGWSLQEIYLIGRQSTGETASANMLIFIVEGRPWLESPPKES